MTTTNKAIAANATLKQKEKKLSARDRIKPRGLSGLYKGRIHYDHNADIFNLEL
jgi:hypothetical protein